MWTFWVQPGVPRTEVGIRMGVIRLCGMGVIRLCAGGGGWGEGVPPPGPIPGPGIRKLRG